MSFSFPIENPILIFGLAMLIFLTAPLLLERYRLPGIIGIIVAGAALGPNGFGILQRGETFTLLGEVGLVYLMFVAGLEINLNQFIEYKDRSLVFGLLSFIIPQTAGTLAGSYVLDLTLEAALLFAAIFSSHTLLAYPVVNRLGIAKNEAITSTIGGTILTDTLALLVLAIVIASVGGTLDATFWLRLTVGLAAFFVGVWLIVPRVGRWFFRSVDQESYFEFLFVMTILFTSAFLAEAIGVKHIIGAFLAGLALNQLIPETGILMNRIEFVGNALFIPFFLLSVGMLVDVWVLLEGIETILIAGSLLVLVVVTKSAAAWMTGRIYRYDNTEILGMFGLSVGQAAAALAIVLIGFDAGVPGFDRNMINGVVVMILVVSLISPMLVERAGQGIRRASEQEPYDPVGAAQRIIIPFSKRSQHKEALLDFALLLRGTQSDEPLYTLSVVPPGEEVDAEVAEVEETLEVTEEYASGAEVPVESRVQVDHNPASGIIRAVLENRITTLVIGWDGAESRQRSIFGSIIDQVLHRTDQVVFVSHVREPVSTTRRLVVILPPGIDHNDGFYEAVHQIKVLSEHTGASIRGLVVEGNADQFERLFTLVELDVPLQFERIDGWKPLLEILSDAIRPNDLLVCVSARRGTIGWHEELQTLPKNISTLIEGNFVIVYPATVDRTDDRQFLRFT
ncbi:cation:proton antiporter [Halocatena pleomorpha]|uniref:Cation:proton antiporter n=1 Tax=Halocatena pleomorpha TaxID=1785090 RepID=A0A3P3RL08_9EURY|nr:cation:proton antiporter [Halocatena pleomorpha]RRJ34004.1 cation:proton antiporter [Halocatena pleomorpha]